MMGLMYSGHCEKLRQGRGNPWSEDEHGLLVVL
jgi:hypothetical protein